MIAEPGLELLHDEQATLGEGPAWDHRQGLLYWVDIIGKRVHLYNPKLRSNRTIQLEQLVGAAVPRKEGGLVLAMQNGLHLLDLETEQVRFLVDPEQDQPGNRFNDGKCDSAGRFWAGTMDMKEEAPRGSLYCLEPDGTLHKKISGVTTSNGMGWSPDDRIMYYIDSPTRKVSAFDFELSTGVISNGRTLFTIPEGEGFPDGMTVDAEGMLWVAQWDGWQVSRWNPATGERIGQIRLPVARVTSCTFGGDNDDELYITTARIGLSEQELAEQPHAGGLFRIRPGVKGRATSFYGG
ncbi:SMP-30/gluconolactonase/LRE family protein [Paenibacillus silviterrae]|uniref:SMP-30/gluconolactonase/LRE family protein n=1 Tax=Paenibacillus silviterrae TaxID=3242194 RepID=UPI0025437E46|nr:SMP-30/gluconolactonase/LRE family protein [Paenibacillus chinjuensis]